MVWFGLSILLLHCLLWFSLRIDGILFQLKAMIQELGKQNPHLMRLIQEHQAEFLQLINEPVEGEG